MKNRFNYLFLLFLVSPLCGCSKVDNKNYSVYFTKEVNLVNVDNSRHFAKKTATLHQFDDNYLFYVGVKDFLNDLEGVFDSSKYYFRSTNDSLCLFIPSVSNKYPSVEFKYNSSIVYFLYDHVTSNIIKSDSLISNNHHIENIKVVADENITPFSFDLSKYDIKFYYSTKSEEVFIPLGLINILFTSSNYYGFVFNGENIYGGKSSDYNNFLKYKGITNISSLSKKEIASLNKESTKEYRFVFDSLYGLKEYKNYVSFDEYIGNESLTLLNSSSQNEFMYERIKIANKKMDEFHTAVVAPGFIVENQAMDYSLKESDIGENHRNYTNYSTRYNELEKLDRVFSDRYNTYFSKDKKTALFKFDSFLDGSDEELKDIQNRYKFDTYYNFDRQFNVISQVKDVKNILIDMSNNGGGSSFALIRALSYIYGESECEYKIRSSLDNSKYRYVFTTKVENSFKDYNVGLILSPMSFSCGNLLPSIISSIHPETKFLGQKSGGGMCAVKIEFLSDGTILGHSSTSLFGIKKGNNDYAEIESGVEPTRGLEFNSIEEYFDYETICNKFASSLENSN